MRCPACEKTVESEDNYCRQCGTALHIIDVPAISNEPRAVAAWNETKPAVMRGVMVFAAGAVFRFVVSRAARAAVSHVLEPGEGGLLPRGLIPFMGDGSARPEADEVEVLWYRRVRR